MGITSRCGLPPENSDAILQMLQTKAIKYVVRVVFFASSDREDNPSSLSVGMVSAPVYLCLKYQDRVIFWSFSRRG